MRLIDADEIPMRTSHVMDMQDLYLPAHFLEWVIDECPTIDAEQVVRCKDCKWCVDDWNGSIPQFSCDLTDSGVFPNSFCSYAERIEQ